MWINKVVKSLEKYSKVFSGIIEQEAYLLFLLFRKYPFSINS